MPDAGGAAAQKLKVFISYSRQDLEFVDRLQTALSVRGIDAAVDRTEIAKGEDWWKRIQQLIVEADTIVFVLSPGSVTSPVCRQEVDFADSIKKRFVPIVAADIGGLQAPSALVRLNYVFFVPHTASGTTGAFEVSMQQLADALETDIGWIREHTRLGALAQRWLTERQSSDLLLRGSELLAAETWITLRPAKAPDPSDAHRAFLTNSRRAAMKRQRWWVGGSVAVAMMGLALSGLAYWQRSIAISQRNIAQEAESLVRSEQAKQTSGDDVAGMLVALEGLPDKAGSIERPFVNNTWQALYGLHLKQRERAILSGHKNTVTSAVFAPDGRRLLTASTDATARLWDADGRHLATLVGHKGPILSAVFSPAGQLIITASNDNTARLWDRDGKPLTTLEGHTAEVRGAVFSPNGERILTTSWDGTARLWGADGKPLATLAGHRDKVNGAVFSPDGQRIVTASDDGTARLWDVDGNALTTFAGHCPPGVFRGISKCGVNSAVFSPDGHRILTASSDATARLWDADGKPLATLNGHCPPGGDYGLHGCAVYSAEFAPNGRHILTASSDSTARLWDADGKPIATIEGHESRLTKAGFSPDGRYILTASSDATARLLDAEGKLLAALKGHCTPEHYGMYGCAVVSAEFSADGSRILTASSDATARLWDTDGGSLATTLEGHCPQGKDYRLLGCRVRSAVFSPNGQRILTASSDTTARLWDADGKPLATMESQGPVNRAMFSPDGQRILTASSPTRIWDADGKLLVTLNDWSSTAIAVISPNGRRILTVSSTTARLWDAEGTPIATLADHTASINSAVFSPDGQRILTASWDATARLWDAEGKQITTLVGHKNSVISAVFSPDGHRILTASRDGSARLWDADGKSRTALVGHQGAVMTAVFSPEGHRILTASADGMAVVWNADGKPLARLEGHCTRGKVRDGLADCAILSAVFSPDGYRMLTASSDGTARLWDVYGQPLAVLEGHCPPGKDHGAMGCQVSSAVFSPDGRRILTASDDGTARIWPAYSDPQELIDVAKERMPRCLTQQQRAQYYLLRGVPAWCKTMGKWPYDAATLAATTAEPRR